DVMMAYPTHFEGTKGIIHPEDLNLVKAALSDLKTVKRVNLQFRIITTYGEIKTLIGQHIFITEPEAEDEVIPEQELLLQVQKQKELQAELANLRQKQQVFEEASKISGAGIWYYNKKTQEVYYSDQLFLLHGLPPQSLNAHLNTFSSFIHHEDRVIVLQAIEKAVNEELPLQLEYRIITANGAERYARNVLQWSYNTAGERLLQGMLQDYSAYRAADIYQEQTEQLLWFHKQRLLFTESSSNSGFWQLNLTTKKFTPSDNFFRLHGLKPQAASASLNSFLNYVHPDDQLLVEGYYQTLRREHSANDIEYRIVRTDGKQRFLRQQAKSMIDDSGQLVLFGLIQDITIIKTLEEKLHEKTERHQLNQYGLSIGESLVNTGTWWWNQESGEQYWSDGMYQLLGYKPQSITITQHHVLKLVHPNYRKVFTDSLTLALHEEQESNFEITLSRSGEPLHLRAAFKLFRFEEKRIFIGVFQDITEERKLRQKLSERIQLADLLTENLPDRILITDNENSILFWNKQCERYYKHKREQVIGKNFFDVFPALQTEEKTKQFNEVLQGQAIHIPATQAPGSKDITDLHMLPLLDADKEVLGILHILHDVTNETTLRQNLTERLHFIQSLVEASVDRIVALDRHMNYIYWNKQAEEYYDLKKEKVLGKNILEVFPAFINDPSYSEFRKALRGETVHISANSIAVDQGSQYFETYLIPVKSASQAVTSVLWITRDLSKEYKLLQQQLKSNDILNSVNAIF
ncbi:MAG TPA: PAS domain S-box protein, partial [Flavisolibacter sp.]|nr:PAS domain S-box protein [Flavisolibacter sp.]